ncbi:MAG: hypothetical protein LC104_01745 [Bacteroidales bacterium]|nr:hypothetical protein [Bacteroidales bacterium]
MHTLLHKLHVWQRREWLFRAAWGFARWSLLVLLGLTVACLIDWFIDRYVETPWSLRVLLTVGQAIAYSVCAYSLIFRLRVPSLDSLAARAEEAFPELGHRLVTAVQLNRPTARTEGMSPVLIAAVTREAESLTAQRDFGQLIDRSRLEWALGVLIPLFVILSAFVAFRPGLVTALLSRQLLLDVAIPRSVQIDHDTATLWPSGDAVELRFLVSGRVQEDTPGRASVYPDDQPAESYPLRFQGRAEDGRAIFTVKLPPASTAFTVVGRVADGRTHHPLRIQFVPRPSLGELAAWVRLPAYVDPAGVRRYERFQPQGEVFAFVDSSVRITAQVSKPIARAEVVLLSRDAAGVERESRRQPMTIAENGTAISTIFEIPQRPSAYRVEVWDEHGFGALNPPRRGITLAPDEPPRVELLPEVLKDPQDPGPPDDFEVNGMPLALGGRVQIGYRARSPLGLSRAYIVYRVNEGPWTPLPLTPTVADIAKLGPFLPELGVFERSGVFGQVEFYRLPPTDPENDPPGLVAGGRFNFQTSSLKKRDAEGMETDLAIGDRVEFFVAVYDRNPAPAEPPAPPVWVDVASRSEARPHTEKRLRAPGRSESRIKSVVTASQLQSWLDQRDQSRERLRQIEERQRGVFTAGK